MRCEVVAVLVTDEDGQVLLTKRSEGRVFAGEWCLPGGKVELDETVQQACERELFEETGLKVWGHPQWLGFLSTPGAKRLEVYSYGRHWTGAVRLNAECTDCGWFDPKDLPRGQLMTEELIARILRHLNPS